MYSFNFVLRVLRRFDTKWRINGWFVCTVAHSPANQYFLACRRLVSKVGFFFSVKCRRIAYYILVFAQSSNCMQQACSRSKFLFGQCLVAPFRHRLRSEYIIMSPWPHLYGSRALGPKCCDPSVGLSVCLSVSCPSSSTPHFKAIWLAYYRTLIGNPVIPMLEVATRVRVATGNVVHGNEAAAASKAFARWLHHRYGPIKLPSTEHIVSPRDIVFTGCRTTDLKDVAMQWLTAGLMLMTPAGELDWWNITLVVILLLSADNSIKCHCVLCEYLGYEGLVVIDRKLWVIRPT